MAKLTTQAQVRAAFFADHPQWRKLMKRAGRSTYSGRVLYRLASHNEYHTDARVAFCNYVDALQKNGTISEALAQRVTLG